MRTLKVMLVADQHFAEQPLWERRATQQVLGIAARIHSLLKINLEVVGHDIWKNKEDNDLFRAASDMVAAVDKGEADAIIGFTIVPCPDPAASSPQYTKGVTIPFKGVLIGTFPDRCLDYNRFADGVMIHEIVHLFGGVHVHASPLMSPLFTDEPMLILDPINQRIVRLTSDMDFHQGYQSLDDNTLKKLSVIYDRAVGGGNNEVTTLYELGAMYLELDDYNRTQGLLGCALKQDSSFTGAWLQLSDCFQKKGTTKVAISILERAKDLADDKGLIFARLARLYFDTGDRGNSLKYAVLAEKHGVKIDLELKDQLK